jgi:predicted enzyme related to lactoylglutathione lyase
VIGPARAGALVYALDLERVATFYERVLSMQRRVSDAEHVVLASADFQLIIHAMPASCRAGMVVTSPPRPRENTAIRLFFTIHSFAVSDSLVASLGGKLLAQSWSGPGFTVRNGYDCEGNVFQLRECVA